MTFMRDFQAREGYSPTVREICKALCLASPGSLMKHLRALEAGGYIDRTPGKNRTWKLAGAPSGKMIPVLGRIAAGSPILAQENLEAELPVDPGLFGCEQTFALRVKGDSMIEAHVQDGDFAIIQPRQIVDDGQIAAVLIDGIESEATLKILKRKPNRVELHPANSAYDPIVFEGADCARVRVLGRMVGVIRSRVHSDRLFPCAGRYFAH